MTAWPCASASTCPRGYERWRDVRVDPRGFGLYGVALAPVEVVRLTHEEDADNIRELAAFAGATLDSLRAAFRAFCRFGRIGTKLRHVLVGVADSDQGS